MIRSQAVRLPRWLAYALLSIAAWGMWGFVAKLGADRIAPGPLQILATVGIFPLALLAFFQLHMRLEKDARGITYGIANGVLSGIGLLAYYAAANRGKVSVVGPVTSLFPLLTVILAFIFLRERLNRMQILGVALSLVAIAIFSQ
jgi:bacterial/archaeal transporter family protein